MQARRQWLNSEADLTAFVSNTEIETGLTGWQCTSISFADCSRIADIGFTFGDTVEQCAEAIKKAQRLRRFVSSYCLALEAEAKRRIEKAEGQE